MYIIIYDTLFNTSLFETWNHWLCTTSELKCVPISSNTTSVNWLLDATDWGKKKLRNQDPPQFQSVWDCPFILTTALNWTTVSAIEVAFIRLSAELGSLQLHWKTGIPFPCQGSSDFQFGIDSFQLCSGSWPSDHFNYAMHSNLALVSMFHQMLLQGYDCTNQN